MFHKLCSWRRGGAHLSAVWLLLFWLAALNADPLPLDPGSDGLSLVPYLEVIADPDQRLTLEQVQDIANYAPRRPVTATPASTYWLRLAVSNPGARAAEWRLVVARADLDEVDFMVVSPAGVLLTQAQAGRGRPFAQRVLRYRLPVFAFELPAGGARLLYLRLHGRAPLAVPPTLLLPESLARQMTRSYLALGLVYGTLAVMLWYNLLFYLAIGDRDSGFLALFIAMMALVLGTLDGLGQQFLWDRGGDPYVTERIGLLALAVALPTAGRLLATARAAPRLDRLLRRLTALLVAMAVLIPLFPAADLILDLAGLAAAAPILAALLIRRGPGGWPQSMVAAAVLALCASGAAQVLTDLEVVPTFACSAYPLHLGAILFTLLMSLAQGQRIDRLCRQAQRAGEQLREERSRSQRRAAAYTRALAADRARAAAASRAKDEFLANVNHEMRTPLNSVIGYAQLLLQEDLSARGRSHLHAVHAAGRALLSLVEGVLDVARIETGQLDLAARPTDLRRLAWELEQVLSRQAADKGLALVITVAPEVPALVQLDPDPLRQILLNLLGNAVKFTAVGRVSLSLGARREAANAWRLEALVSDTGPGIAPELTERVFERFARGSGERRTVTQGSGLGLAISRRLARAMGGDIHLESSPGRGSRFTLVLPAVSGAADPEAGTAAPGAVRFVPGDVLVADDDPLHRRLLTELLGKAGLRVAAAADGHEALALARRHRPLLVLMDLQMPRLDGFATARTMRADPVLAVIPLIALTAMADTQTLQRLPGPFDGHLFKPWEYQSLLRLLARFLPTLGSDGARPPDVPPAPPPPLPRPRTPILLEPGDWAQWSRLADEASINEIAAFGRRLAWVGRALDDPAVDTLGERLREQAESFELAAMQTTLRHLADHVCPRAPGAR